ncbi:hypothetical protein EVS87_012335 [Bacillus altitudinis]|nr:hypothetical protein EVS87_012335 [Bacillus altitudinis]
MIEKLIIKVPIPFVYLSLSKSSRNQAALFRAYVKGYIQRNEPGLTFIRISGMYALCEVKRP